MNVLVINCGSSSLKYELFECDTQRALASCLVERIGEANSRLQLRVQNASGDWQTITRKDSLADHRAAFTAVTSAMREAGLAVQLRNIAAIGHRVVHGGEAFTTATRIDANVVEGIRDLIPLAPLHNPLNLLGIEICLEIFPDVPQVAVFDTAFHQTMPPYAYHYAVPDELYRNHHVRRYGFHGTSHAYVASQAAQYLQRPLSELNLISLHLGNGASAAAIAGGRSVDTSMGMTPLEGLMMGTRCGDLDPALSFTMARETGKSLDEIEAMLNHDSGLKGVCGDNDMREVIARAEQGDASAELALTMFCYRIRKYIGAYSVVLGRLDALIFTAGIGENVPQVRARACAGLERLGVELDLERNSTAEGDVTEVQTDGAPVKLLVVATDEEWEIVQQTMRVLEADQ